MDLRLFDISLPSPVHAQIYVAAIACLTLCGCGRRVECAAPDAPSIVHGLDARRQFRNLLSRTVRTTETGGMVAAHDPQFGDHLQKAVDRAVARHGGEWEANLVASYRSSLSSDQMTRVCDAMRQGDWSMFDAVTTPVGRAMQAESTPLLQASAAEVLTDLLKAN